MNELGDRINLLIEDIGISKNWFAKKIGISSSLISQITTKKNNFRADILQKIVSAYPDLNSSWLLSGIGDMWEGSYKINKLGLRVENQKNQKSNLKKSIDDPKSNEDNFSIINNQSIQLPKTFLIDINKKTKFWINLFKIDPKLDDTLTEISELDNNISQLQELLRSIYQITNKIDNELISLDQNTINSEKYKKQVLQELEAVKAYNEEIINLNRLINSVLLFIRK